MAASARLNVFADAVVSAIQAGLDAGDGTEVVRSFGPDVLLPDYDPTAIEHRKVYVVPFTRRQVEGGTRGQDVYEYTIGTLTVRRYAEPGDAPDDWIDSEMAWQEVYVDDQLSGVRTADTAAAILATEGRCETAEPEYAYEPEALQGRKLFLSAQVFTFRKAE